MLSRGAAWGGRVREVEGAVRGEAGAAVVQAVPALDQQHLVPCHRGRVVPALRGVMRQMVDLADPVGEQLVGRDQVFRPHGRGVGECQGRALDGPPDRAPDVDLDDPGAGRGKPRGLGLAEEIPDPLRAALFGVVDVHPARRAAQAVPVLSTCAAVRAPGRVEDDDAARPDRGAQQRLDLRVVDLLERVVVVQVFGALSWRRSSNPSWSSESASACGRRSWILTTWRSVSKNTRGAAPVSAELWNTGFSSERVMKVSAARTSAEVRRRGRRAFEDSLAHGSSSSIGWPTCGQSLAA